MIDSWRGVRPAIHYSYSRDTALPEGFAHSDFPNMPALLEAGHKKAKLRAHSDFYPNQLVNNWALSFLPYTDIMCESKMKNLASIELYNYANTRKDQLSKGINELLRFQQSQNQSNTETFTATEEMLPVS